jgi:hypothetical protein
MDARLHTNHQLGQNLGQFVPVAPRGGKVGWDGRVSLIGTPSHPNRPLQPKSIQSTARVVPLFVPVFIPFIPL